MGTSAKRTERFAGTDFLHNRNRRTLALAPTTPSANVQRQRTDWAAWFEEYGKVCPDDGKPLSNEEEATAYIEELRRGFGEFMNARNA